MKIRTIWAPLPFRLAVLAVCVLGLSAPARAEDGGRVVAALQAANRSLGARYDELRGLRRQANPSENRILTLQAKMHEDASACKAAVEAYQRLLKAGVGTIPEADLLVARSVVLCQEMQPQFRKLMTPRARVPDLGPTEAKQFADKTTHDVLNRGSAKKDWQSALEERNALEALDSRAQDELMDAVAASIRKQVTDSLAGEGDRIRNLDFEEAGGVLERLIKEEEKHRIGGASLRFSDDKVEVYVDGKKVWEAALPEALKQGLRGRGQLAARDEMWQEKIRELLQRRPDDPPRGAEPSPAGLQRAIDWLRRAEGALAGSKRIADAPDSGGGAAGMSKALSTRRTHLEWAVSRVRSAWGTHLKNSSRLLQLKKDTEFLAKLLEFLVVQPGGGTAGPVPRPPRERERDGGMNENDMIGTWLGQAGGPFEGKTLVIRKERATNFVGTVDGKQVFVLYAPSGPGFGGDPYAEGDVTVTRRGREVTEKWRIALDSRTQLKLTTGGGGTATFRKQ